MYAIPSTAIDAIPPTLRICLYTLCFILLYFNSNHFVNHPRLIKPYSLFLLNSEKTLEQQANFSDTLGNHSAAAVLKAANVVHTKPILIPINSLLPSIDNCRPGRNLDRIIYAATGIFKCHLIRHIICPHY
jgi:hypothetical protein